MTKLPLDQIAAQLGVDEATAAAATKEASAALAQGMKADAQDQAGAESLAKPIAAHAQQVADKTADDIDVAKIGTADGEKIVKNVFGDNEEQVVNQLGGSVAAAARSRACCRCSPRSCGLPRQAGGRQGRRRGRWQRAGRHARWPPRRRQALIPGCATRCRRTSKVRRPHVHDKGDQCTDVSS